MKDMQATLATARERRISEIRMIALSEVLGGTADCNFETYFDELDHITDHPASAAWHEAQVLLCVINRIDAKRALSHLGIARTMRADCGMSDQFVRLEQQIRNYLSPLTLTVHGYHDVNFAHLDHGGVWQQVDHHLSVLRAAGYEAFLNSGTLLGMVRDARLIDHDDDIDLAIMLRATDMRDAAVEWRGMQDVLSALDLLESTVDGMPGIYKLRPAGNVQIDLFPAWAQDGRVFVYPHTHGALAIEELLPLRPCKLTGQALPAMPERLLEANYGAGWRKPDPLFKFPWGEANKSFAPFLERLVH